MDSEATCRIKAGTRPFLAVVLGLCFMGDKMPLLQEEVSGWVEGQWMEGRTRPAKPGHLPGGEREPGKTQNPGNKLGETTFPATYSRKSYIAQAL